MIDKGSASIIDGTGKHLAPGLADMHAHVPLPGPENDNAEEVLFLYLANGVTTIRMMVGHAEHLEMREKVRSGDLPGPRIFLAGPAFDMNSASSYAAVESMLMQQKQLGYDFVKIRPGVDLPIFDHIVKTANALGLGFSGHVPVSVGIRHALEAGYRSVEHLDGYMEGMIPDSLELDPDDNGNFGFNYVDFTDLALLDGLITATATNTT
jgi:imidazolonepropionase-like amidohydrolase